MPYCVVYLGMSLGFASEQWLMYYTDYVMSSLQAKEGSGRDALRKRRPLLVSAGIALAPDAFQTVLDADSKNKGYVHI